MPRFFMYLPWDDDKRLAEAAYSFTDRLERGWNASAAIRKPSS